MGLFDSMKGKRLGLRAYRQHVAAMQLRQQGKHQEAQQKLDEAFAMYGESYQLGFRKCTVLLAYAILTMQRGDFSRARELMLEVNKDKSMSQQDRFTLRVNYAICQWKMGQLDKAIETMQTAGQMKKNGQFYTTMGMLYVEKAHQTGDIEEALAFNQEAMEYDDEDPATLDNIAQLYVIKASQPGNEQAEEDRRTALGYIRKAYEIKHDQITSVYYYAKLSHEMGDDDTARKVIDDSKDFVVSSLCPITRADLDKLRSELK